MKRITLAAVTAAALLIPAMASAQGTQLVYRPELRGMVPVRQKAAAPAARSAVESIARHQAMAAAYRGTKHAQAAAHCERQIANARKPS